MSVGTGPTGPIESARGLFICLEGGEGSGKTSMATRLKAYMEKLGRTVVEVADPGTTVLAQRARSIVLDASIPCNPEQQALLYILARSSLAEEVRQHLAAGRDVIAARWTLSTQVYQGLLGKVGLETISWLTRRFVNLDPDIYILLDASPELALARKRQAVGDAAMAADRFDGRDLTWHNSLRAAYLHVAGVYRYDIVNADKSLNDVETDVITACQCHQCFRERVSCLNCSTGPVVGHTAGLQALAVG